MAVNNIIYKVEAMIHEDGKNRTGIMAMYENQCLFYNENSLIRQFDFEIKKANIIDGEEEISFLDLYKKKKHYFQIQCGNKYSFKIFLDEKHTDLLVGKFEQRKAEIKNYSLVVKALECGYTGSVCKDIERNNSKPLKNKICDPDEVLCWEDLLTPIEWRDYYQSLGAQGKIVYDAILHGIIDCKEYVCVENIKLTNDAVGVIYHYILWDNPAVFCIGEYAMWRAVEKNGKYIRITSLCGDASNELRLREMVFAAVKKFLNNPKLCTWSDIQKEKYVHDYIVKNWVYDQTKGNNGARLEPYTIYGALVERTAVCEGFAKTVKLLLDLLGVHTQIVSGTVKSMNAGHAWNVVNIDGFSYHLDVTFDIGQTGGRQYAIRYDYFNVPAEDLIDRTWHDSAVVWKCDSRKHSYPACVGGLVGSEDEVRKYIYKELSKRKAYMYVKFVDLLRGKTQNWLQGQYEIVKRACNSRSQAVVIVTNIKDMYVIAVQY